MKKETSPRSVVSRGRSSPSTKKRKRDETEDPSAYCMDETSYLRQAPVVGENDPTLLISWYSDLSEFVTFANHPDRMNRRPMWMREGMITVSALQEDIVSFLREVGGGSFSTTLIGPNTLIEYGNVRERLRDIEQDPFMQECISLLPHGGALASIRAITERSLVNARPLHRIAAPRTRLLFV